MADQNENVKVEKKPVEYFAGEAVTIKIRKKQIEAIVVEDKQIKAWTARFKESIRVAYICDKLCYHECFVSSALVIKEDYNQ